MIKVAQILGLVGGVGDAILTSLIILIVRVRRFLDRASSGEVFPVGVPVWSYVLFMLAVAGIVGADLVRVKPRAGGIVLLVSGAGGIVTVISRVMMTGRVSGTDPVEGFLSLLLLSSGVLGMISYRRQQAKIDHG